jgi:hypothetical protein
MLTGERPPGAEENYIDHIECLNSGEDGDPYNFVSADDN